MKDMVVMRSQIFAVNCLHVIKSLLTFAYAILFSSLTIYLTNSLGLSVKYANSIVAIFFSVGVVIHLVSGFLVGKYISNRVLLLLAIIIQALGIYMLSFLDTQLLIYGLSLFILGSSLNSVTMQCLLTMQFPGENNAGREPAFFINYAAMNIGFFLGFLVSGYYSMHNRYIPLFYLGILFTMVSAICLILPWRNYGEELSTARHSGLYKNMVVIITLVSLFIIPMLALHYHNLSNSLILGLGGFAFLVFIFYIKFMPVGQERSKLILLLFIILASVIFWSLSYITPIGMMHFLQHGVDNIILGHAIAPQWYMNLNPILIIVLAPSLAFFLKKIRIKKMLASPINQFCLGLFLVSLSLFTICLGILKTTNFGLVSSLWVVMYFVLQSFAEIFIGPTAYSMVGQLVPSRLLGVMMGFFAITGSISSALSYFFSNMLYCNETANCNIHYLHVFAKLGCLALSAALLFLIFKQKINNFINN
jgi:proton-dependent oligopeptide transporter, POT family